MELIIRDYVISAKLTLENFRRPEAELSRMHLFLFLSSFPLSLSLCQAGPCTAWNLTIHEYKRNGDPAGPRLHTFCSRDTHKNFTLPWKMNTAVVR